MGATSPAVRTAVVEFVEKLDLKDLTLAGESIGATLSLSTSTQLDRRVRNIIALNTYDYPEGLSEPISLPRSLSRQ